MKLLSNVFQRITSFFKGVVEAIMEAKQMQAEYYLKKSKDLD